MSTVKVQGNASGSGSITISSPNTNSNRVQTLPDVDGNIITTGDTGTVTPAMLSQKLTQTASVASTSGTSIDFTGIPSWVKKITVMLSGVSTTGTGTIWLQLGTSGGVETSSYVSTIASFSTTANTTNSSNSVTSAIPFYHTTVLAADTLTAMFTWVNLTGNTWVGQGGGLQGTRTVVNSGSKTLSGVLDRVRVTTSNGTDTFDAGTINIIYEG